MLTWQGLWSKLHALSSGVCGADLTQRNVDIEIGPMGDFSFAVTGIEGSLNRSESTRKGYTDM